MNKKKMEKRSAQRFTKIKRKDNDNEKRRKKIPHRTEAEEEGKKS